MLRYALGLQYSGERYAGWQVQPEHSGVKTLQVTLQRAISEIAARPVEVVCTGRTDTGVHALQQIVHFDTDATRPNAAWVRGVNALLPADMAVQWVQAVPAHFHARHSAAARRYTYVLLSQPVRPALAHPQVGWTHYPLDVSSMRAASQLLVGQHDFSSFRAASCQAQSPVRILSELSIQVASHKTDRQVIYVTTQANGFLHHMIRNIMGALIAVGAGRQTLAEFERVFLARDRKQGAPTFSPNGLYFCGAMYPEFATIPQPVQHPFDAASGGWPWAY